MNSIALCQWRTSFAAVLFETDEVRFKVRIVDALKAIDERLQSVATVGAIERISIETARRSLAMLEREPFFVPRPPLKLKRAQYGVGSHVRVTSPSGEVVAAEIVVIFTASSGKNILVSFDKRFMRIGREQILGCMGAKV